MVVLVLIGGLFRGLWRLVSPLKVKKYILILNVLENFISIFHNISIFFEMYI